MLFRSEAAHGYAALRFGDDTALQAGRISLNPLRHIDPVGTVILPGLLLLASGGQIMFGFAKPVPVDFGRLRNPKRDMIWVAMAGPGANLFMALVAGVGLHTLKGNATHPALMEFRQMRSTQEGILWGNKATIIEFKKKHGE